MTHLRRLAACLLTASAGLALLAGPAVASQPRPDLIAASLTIDPPFPEPGAAVMFGAGVRNSANGTAAGDFSVRFVLDAGTANESILSEHRIAGLAPGQASNVTSPPWNATAGDHTIRVIVDPYNEVDEELESNNSRQTSFTVGYPDLVAVDIRFDGAVPQAGQSERFVARMRNCGHNPALDFAVRFYVDGILHSEVTRMTLWNGCFLAGVLSPRWTATPGTHTARVVLDPYDQIGELDEGNNEAAFTFAVPKPDLTVASLAVPATPLEGDDVTFTGTIRNIGASPAGPFVARFLVDGKTLSDHRLPGLAAGAAINVTSAMWSAIAGDHHVELVADALDEIEEENEGNNNRTGSTFVRRYAVELSPPHQALDVAPLGTAKYEIAVRNAGNVVDHISLGTSDVPPGWTARLSETELTLAPGATAIVQLHVSPPLALSGSASIDVIGRSQGDPSKSDTARTLTTIRLL